MQFESITGLGLNADALIRAYFSFANGTLDQATDTSNGPKVINQLRALRTYAAMYATRAREIEASPDFAALDVKVQHDIVAIAEESEKALDDIDDEVEPDRKWTKLSRQEKEDATERLRADNAQLGKIRARLKGQMRGQS